MNRFEDDNQEEIEMESPGQKVSKTSPAAQKFDIK